MNYYEEVKKITAKYLHDDIWEYPEKLGWVNQCIFKDLKLDPHNLSIKFGSNIVAVLFEIGELCLGVKFPKYFAGFGVSQSEAKKLFLASSKSKSKKPTDAVIYTTLDIKKVKLMLYSAVLDVMDNSKKPLTQKAIRALSAKILRNPPRTKTISEVKVDLLAKIGEILTPLEIKLSGDCDSGKSVMFLIDSMLLPYVCLGNTKKELYFGIISDNKINKNKNKNKNTSKWGGSLSALIDQQMILREKSLFDLLTGGKISFKDIQKIIVNRLNYTQKLVTNPVKATRKTSKLTSKIRSKNKSSRKSFASVQKRTNGSKRS